MFVAMGVGGGLAGAAMVWLNQRVTNLRKRFVPATQPSRRVAEVVLLAAVTSSVWLLLCYVSPCGEVPHNASPFIGGAVLGPREGPPGGEDRDSPLLYTNIFPQVGLAGKGVELVVCARGLPGAQGESIWIGRI